MSPLGLQGANFCREPANILCMDIRCSARSRHGSAAEWPEWVDLTRWPAVEE
jgi:hypothetical protein